MNGRFHPDHLNKQSYGAANFSQWALNVIYHQELEANREIMDMWIQDSDNKL
jgi:hypothetical protein